MTGRRHPLPAFTPTFDDDALRRAGESRSQDWFVAASGSALGNQDAGLSMVKGSPLSEQHETHPHLRKVRTFRCEVVAAIPGAPDYWNGE
jgi:hypothetical protein